MKKIMIIACIAAIFTVLATTALAAPPSCDSFGYDFEQSGGVGDIDTECTNAGYDFGIAKWNYNETIDLFQLESQASGYNSSVNGTDMTAYWNVTPAAKGILSKEGRCYQNLTGGTTGSVTKLNFGISHVTMCGMDMPNGDIPEFTTIGMIIASLGALGIVLRKAL